MTLKSKKDNILNAYLADEEEIVKVLKSEISLSKTSNKNITDKTINIIEELRSSKTPHKMDDFLEEFSLSTKEGVALLCIAEAVLRIPDKSTIDQIIDDKFSDLGWFDHIKKDNSLLINSSSLLFMLSGKIINFTHIEKKGINRLIKTTISKLGDPIIRKAVIEGVKLLSEQFISGKNIKDAINNTQKHYSSFRYSYDMLGEAAVTMDESNDYFKSYKNAIKEISNNVKHADPITNPGISVKLSALHPRYEAIKKCEIFDIMSSRLLELSLCAKKAGISLIIDAEESDRLMLSLDLFETVYSNDQLDDWSGLGIAIQAYQKRAYYIIDWLDELTNKYQKPLMVRLVKGAYWDSEIKNAQMKGLKNYPVFSRKEATDLSYLACANKLLQLREYIYIGFATHNIHTLISVLEMAENNFNGFEFQRLYGMGQLLYNRLYKENQSANVRIYSPVGNHNQLLAYLVRRLLENGSNSSFIHNLYNKSISAKSLSRNPVEKINRVITKSQKKPQISISHPNIPLPKDIYGEDRLNSEGYDINNLNDIEPLLEKVKKASNKYFYASSLINGKERTGKERFLYNPADRNEKIGSITDATKDDVKDAIEYAKTGFLEWDKIDIKQRVKYIENLAKLIEKNRPIIMSMLIKEAGKTIGDALSEIREAVDFCRYYALSGKKLFSKAQKLPGYIGEENLLSMHGRGVFIAISPWNFPLAIFVGQITAALIAGNSVISKPAEQTSIIASFIIKLLYKTGIPKNAVHLLVGTGELIGESLISNKDISGVVFTGSIETAQRINKVLSLRKGAIIPLIAETGGQNAMIVDSTSLPQQVVKDVIESSFYSAGQRCSALRILFLQEEIADKVINLLCNALDNITVGNPIELNTDIGPIIDNDALSSLKEHIAYMKDKAVNSICKKNSKGFFLEPHIFEIKDLKYIRREVFGPILHIVRYKDKDLDKVIKMINDKQYGLTFGIQSRISHKVQKIFNNIRVGNTYVNRNMVGAVVGVQPFGGEGLSGTGMKAGGPNYLLRFATERVLTINSTALGGNTELANI